MCWTPDAEALWVSLASRQTVACRSLSTWWIAALAEPLSVVSTVWHSFFFRALHSLWHLCLARSPWNVLSGSILTCEMHETWRTEVMATFGTCGPSKQIQWCISNTFQLWTVSKLSLLLSLGSSLCLSSWCNKALGHSERIKNDCFADSASLRAQSMQYAQHRSRLKHIAACRRRNCSRNVAWSFVTAYYCVLCHLFPRLSLFSGYFDLRWTKW